jgi:hypothetical protein
MVYAANQHVMWRLLKWTDMSLGLAHLAALGGSCWVMTCEIAVFRASEECIALPSVQPLARFCKNYNPFLQREPARPVVRIATCHADRRNSITPTQLIPGASLISSTQTQGGFQLVVRVPAAVYQP